MKVFKFGGASVKDAAAIRNLCKILNLYSDENLFIVISAMGKTTNFLEKVVDAYYHKRKQLPSLMTELRQQYETVAKDLDPSDEMKLMEALQPHLNQLQHEISKDHSHNFDFDYDRIVCFGELISTTLISKYLNAIGLTNHWLDARRLICTDATFREGKVNWKSSGDLIHNAVQEAEDQGYRLIISQGFLGGTAENLTTTLGREGSDYSAAIFAYSLDAESVTIWKDVDGLLNVDPKRFSNPIKLENIPYEEAIELAYYGASVIHYKTLKPLQNKNIPLYVKSFLHPERSGSTIADCPLSTDVPSYIIKDHQLLMTIFPRDFSLIAVENLSEILSILSKNRIKINLMQNSALSFSVCTDELPNRLNACMKALNKKYLVKFNEDVQLVTIRHYQQDSLRRVLGDREILVEQISRTTLQVVTPMPEETN